MSSTRATLKTFHKYLKRGVFLSFYISLPPPTPRPQRYRSRIRLKCLNRFSSTLEERKLNRISFNKQSNLFPLPHSHLVHLHGDSAIGIDEMDTKKEKRKKFEFTILCGEREKQNYTKTFTNLIGLRKDTVRRT